MWDDLEDDWPEAKELQRKIARRILRVSKRTSNEVVLGELGWMTLKARRRMLQLFFWAKILEMPQDEVGEESVPGGQTAPTDSSEQSELVQLHSGCPGRARPGRALGQSVSSTGLEGVGETEGPGTGGERLEGAHGHEAKVRHL